MAKQKQTSKPVQATLAKRPRRGSHRHFSELSMEVDLGGGNLSFDHSRPFASRVFRSSENLCAIVLICNLHTLLLGRNQVRKSGSVSLALRKQ
jgi:hypothetical protein